MIILIAGASGSGKSTVKDKLVAELGEDKCAVICIDDYYKDQSGLDPEERVGINYDDSDTVEMAWVRRDLIALKNKQSIQSPIYDMTTHTRTGEFRTVTPKEHIILESIFGHDDMIRDLGDLKVFVKVDPDIALLRRIRRDMAERGRTLEQILEQYERDVQPNRKFKIDPLKKFADIVIDNNNNDMTIDISKILQAVADFEANQETICTKAKNAAASAWGMFGSFTTYMTQKMEAVDAAVAQYGDVRREDAPAPGSPK